MSQITISIPTFSEQEINAIRKDFPVLDQKVHGKPLAFLDNGASSQMPDRVLNKIREYRHTQHANVHRGVHYLSQVATQSYESAREIVQRFINAQHFEEIVWTSGTTDSINTIAASFAKDYIQPGDEILISEMEHHANIVSWQIHCVSKGAKLKVIPVDDNGELILNDIDNLLTERTKFISLIHISNVLGTINPVKEIIRKAKAKHIPVLLDGAQGIAHSIVDVQDLDCDFYVFSGHKIFGPTGIGVLYGKKEWLSKLEPVKGGGDMIQEVTFESSTWNDLPYKFEAGTPNISGAIGLGEALNYVTDLGMDKIVAYEHTLLEYVTEQINKIDGVSIMGRAKKKSAILSFLMDDIHPHDVGTILDHEGVAVRAGHHCAQPLMRRFNVPASTRASFAVYNLPSEIDQLINAIKQVKTIFA